MSNTTTPTTPAFDINQALLNMQAGQKKSSFIGDTRDTVSELARATKSLAKTVTLVIDENRAEMYADMDPKTMEAMVAMRSAGL